MGAKPDAKEGQLEADAWVKTTRDKRRKTETLQPSRPLSKERDEGKGRIIYKAYDKTRAEQAEATAGGVIRQLQDLLRTCPYVILGSH